MFEIEECGKGKGAFASVEHAVGFDVAGHAVDYVGD